MWFKKKPTFQEQIKQCVEEEIKDAEPYSEVHETVFSILKDCDVDWDLVKQIEPMISGIKNDKARDCVMLQTYFCYKKIEREAKLHLGKAPANPKSRT